MVYLMQAANVTGCLHVFG